MTTARATMSCHYTYTLYGSRGSDVSVILNVTLDLEKSGNCVISRVVSVQTWNMY